MPTTICWPAVTAPLRPIHVSSSCTNSSSTFCWLVLAMLGSARLGSASPGPVLIGSTSSARSFQRTLLEAILESAGNGSATRPA